MTLSIIGAGFGRTGTTSLKEAIDQLGLGPCYHFDEVAVNPGHDKVWLDVVNGAKVDWRAVFADYRATVDWPGCHYWDSLLAEFPSAKVLLSVRDPESWYESALNTLYRTLMTYDTQGNQVHFNMLEMARKMMLEDTFHGRFEDRSYAIDIFKKHNDKVITSVKPNRLLVYEVSEGWGPLCKFFDVPIPNTPFPKKNTSSEYLSLWH